MFESAAGTLLVESRRLMMCDRFIVAVIIDASVSVSGDQILLAC